MTADGPVIAMEWRKGRTRKGFSKKGGLYQEPKSMVVRREGIAMIVQDVDGDGAEKSSARGGECAERR